MVSQGEAFSRALAVDEVKIYKLFLMNGLEWDESLLRIRKAFRVDSYDYMSPLRSLTHYGRPKCIKTIFETSNSYYPLFENYLICAIQWNDVDLVRAFPKDEFFRISYFSSHPMSPVQIVFLYQSHEVLVELLEKGVVYDNEIQEPIYCTNELPKVFKGRGLPCKAYSELPEPIALDSPITVTIKTSEDKIYTFIADQKTWELDVKLYVANLGINIPRNCYIVYNPDGVNDLKGPTATIEFRPGWYSPLFKPFIPDNFPKIPDEYLQ